MAYKLQIRRGLLSALPIGISGEPLFATDTNDLYISNGTTNQKFQKFIASGTSSQFLKGDGSLDSTTYVPTSRTLTINGTSYDLSADRSWTISSANIYTADGTLTGNRTVNQSTYWLKFSGNIGINITPIVKLHIAETTANAEAFKVETNITGTAIGNMQGISIQNNGGLSTFGGFIFRDSAGFAQAGFGFQNMDNTNHYGDIAFATRSGSGFGERMRLTSAGRFLLGTTTESTYLLDVNGTARVSSNLTASSFIKSGGTSTQYLMADGSTSTLTNPVTGTGTTNYLPKWTSGSALGNSTLQTDAAGNLGLNRTPFSWGSSYSVFENKLYSSSYSSDAGIVGLSFNAYNDGTNWVYKNTTFANRFESTLDSFKWFVAASGTSGTSITFTQAMTLTSGGNLQLGTTSGGNWRFLCYQNASTGSANSSALMARQDGSDDVAQFWSSGSNIASIKSNGNLLVGSIIDSGEKLQVSGSLKATNAILLGGNSDVLNFKFSSGYGNTSLATIFDSVADTGNHLIFKINNAAGTATERMRIAGNGSVMIATSTNTGESLIVGGTLKVTGATTFTNDVTVSGVLQETVTTNRQTASYTLALADRGKLVEMNVATANNLTVPLNSSIAFPIGTKIDLAQYGAGQTTVVATSGVTVRSAGGALKLSSQYSGATLVKIATDEWYLFGNITV